MGEVRDRIEVLEAQARRDAYTIKGLLEYEDRANELEAALAAAVRAGGNAAALAVALTNLMSVAAQYMDTGRGDLDGCLVASEEVLARFVKEQP